MSAIKSDTEEICLIDWLTHDKTYLLNIATGEVRESPVKISRYCGFGAFITEGLFKKESFFAALYAYQNSIWLRIGELVIDCTDKQVAVNIEQVSLLVNRIVLRCNSKEMFELKINFFSYFKEFPDDPDGHFLTYIGHTLRSFARIHRFIYLFTAKASGRDTCSQDFVDELDEYVKKKYDEEYALLFDE